MHMPRAPLRLQCVSHLTLVHPFPHSRMPTLLLYTVDKLQQDTAKYMDGEGGMIEEVLF